MAETDDRPMDDKDYKLQFEMSCEIFEDIKKVLEKVGCCHGHSSAGTPPMMFPEWVCCAVKHTMDKAYRLGLKDGETGLFGHKNKTEVKLTQEQINELLDMK